MEDRQQNVRVNTEESDPKFVFDSCCCCIPLRTGCLILGYLQLFGSLVATLSFLFTLGGGGNIQSYSYQQQLGQEVPTMSTADKVILQIYLPFAVLLLIGLHKERPNYVKCYVLFYAIMTVVYAIYKLTLGTGKDIGTAIISSLVNFYFVLVMRSHYIKMGQSANNLPPQQYDEEQKAYDTAPAAPAHWATSGDN